MYASARSVLDGLASGPVYETLRRVMGACVKQTGRWNSWREGDNVYFFQESYDRLPDREVVMVGHVFACGPGGRCIWVGEFRILRDGTLSGPAAFGRLVQAKANRAVHDSLPHCRAGALRSAIAW